MGGKGGMGGSRRKEERGWAGDGLEGEGRDEGDGGEEERGRECRMDERKEGRTGGRTEQNSI